MTWNIDVSYYIYLGKQLTAYLNVHCKLRSGCKDVCRVIQMLNRAAVVEVS